MLTPASLTALLGAGLFLGAIVVVPEPDLVLVDGELPDMNAATLARAWAAAEPAGSGTQAPLVAITAHSDPASLARYRAAGLDPVLNKPLRKSHLLSVLTPLLASERPKRR